MDLKLVLIFNVVLTGYIVQAQALFPLFGGIQCFVDFILGIVVGLSNCPPTQPPVQAPVVGRRCPPKWVCICEDCSRCYKFGNTTATWDDARRDCYAQEGSLVRIEDKDESDCITAYLQQHLHADLNETDVWTAGNDITQNGNYVWGATDEQLELPPIEFNNWKDGEPARNAINGCVELDHDTEWMWKEENCYVENNYLCERAPIPCT